MILKSGHFYLGKEIKEKLDNTDWFILKTNNMLSSIKRRHKDINDDMIYYIIRYEREDDIAYKLIKASKIMEQKTFMYCMKTKEFRR